MIYRVAPGTKAEMECLYNRRVNVTDGGWKVNVESDMITTDITSDTNNVASNIENIVKLSVDDENLNDLVSNEIGINLGDYIPFTVSLLNNTDIFDYRIEDCWATPDNNPTNEIQFQLADNGCPTETWIEVNKTTVGFELFAFFTSSDFYLHCGVLLCGTGDVECDAQQCNSRRKRSAFVRYQYFDNVFH